MIHVITWITTHLLTPEGWKAELEAYARNMRGGTQKVNSQWIHTQLSGHSGLVAARLLVARDVPGSNPRCIQKFLFFTKITAIRSFGHGLHTYCSAEVHSAFYPPRKGNWVSTLLLSTNTKWRWANVWPIAAYRWTSLQPGLRVGSHLALTNFGPDEPQWTLSYGWCREW